jgi:hypothetical protein
MQSGNGATAAAAGSLTTLYNQLASTVPTAAHAPLLGNGETLTAGVYNITGQTTLSNVLNLDAQGNSNAVFIFKISAVLSTTTASQVNLINGALACNIFWKVEGAVNIGSLSSMKGTVVANNGAIDNITTGCSGGTLPLTLINLTGNVQNTNGMLTWRTSNEQSTKLFEVEESIDGRAYARIGTVNATGTTASEQNYNYTSNNINRIAPSIYYRLKMIDADGKFTYSNTIVLQFKSTVSVSFYPNPVVNIATLTLTSRSAERMSYNIIDNYGKLVHTETVNLTEGFNNININVKTLSPGLYFLSIRGNQLNERVKFVKK